MFKITYQIFGRLFFYMYICTTLINQYTMAQKVKIDLKKTIYAIYEKQGMIVACDWASEHNRVSGAKSQIPFEWCEACDNHTPSIKHECCLCGQATEPQTAPKFYQAVLKPVKDVIKHVYPKYHKEMTLEERLPNNARCENCGKNEWILLPKESIAVRESGKQYIECMGCGETTHL